LTQTVEKHIFLNEILNIFTSDKSIKREKRRYGRRFRKGDIREPFYKYTNHQKLHSMIKKIYNFIENKFVLIFWIVAFLCVAFFIGDGLIHNRMSEKKFFLNTLTGKIEDVKHEVKGYYILKVDTSWIYLSYYGQCIDTIYIGDSIFKPSNSFSITVKL